MAVTTVEVLELAAVIVARGWARGAYAHNAQGEDVSERTAEAVKFCALGAMRRAAWELMGKPETGDWARRAAFLQEAAGEALGAQLDALAEDWEAVCAEWNDHAGRTAAEVEGALREAAAAERAAFARDAELPHG